jgi:hypothetical protein
MAAFVRGNARHVLLRKCIAALGSKLLWLIICGAHRWLPLFFAVGAFTFGEGSARGPHTPLDSCLTSKTHDAGH